MNSKIVGHISAECHRDLGVQRSSSPQTVASYHLVLKQPYNHQLVLKHQQAFKPKKAKAGRRVAKISPKISPNPLKNNVETDISNLLTELITEPLARITS